MADVEQQFEAAVNVIRSMPKKGSLHNPSVKFKPHYESFIDLSFVVVCKILGTYQPSYETMLKVGTKFCLIKYKLILLDIILILSCF